jgi:hypothetical protein
MLSDLEVVAFAEVEGDLGSTIEPINLSVRGSIDTPASAFAPTTEKTGIFQACPELLSGEQARLGAAPWRLQR